MASRPATNFAHASIQMEVLRTFAGTERLRGIWDETTARLGSTVYMSYDWCRTWWEFYGRKKELVIFVFKQGCAIAGILPMYIESLGLRPARFRVARLVGANIPPKLFNPAVAPAHAEEIFTAMIRELIGKEGCDLISFGLVAEQYGGIAALRKASMDCSDLTGPGRLYAAGVHSIIHLPEDYDVYLKSVGRKARYYLRKDESRLLSEKYRGTVDVVREPEKLEEEYGRFVDQHARQWATQGRKGHFGSWPKGMEYNHALVKRLGELGRVRFIRIVTKQGVVARQYVFAFAQSYFWELPSREVGQEWDDLGLGRTGAAVMIRKAIEEKMCRIAAGLGHYDYKNRLNAVEHGAFLFRVASNRPGARARYCLFMALSGLMRICYHKILYRRIMPRLPMRFRRGQWRLWLSLDF